MDPIWGSLHLTGDTDYDEVRDGDDCCCCCSGMRSPVSGNYYEMTMKRRRTWNYDYYYDHYCWMMRRNFCDGDWMILLTRDDDHVRGDPFDRMIDPLTMMMRMRDGGVICCAYCCYFHSHCQTHADCRVQCDLHDWNGASLKGDHHSCQPQPLIHPMLILLLRLILLTWSGMRSPIYCLTERLQLLPLPS